MILTHAFIDGVLGVFHKREDFSLHVKRAYAMAMLTGKIPFRIFIVHDPSLMERM